MCTFWRHSPFLCAPQPVVQQLPSGEQAYVMADFNDLNFSTGRMCNVCRKYTAWACKCDQDTEVWLCHIPSATHSVCWKTYHNLPNADFFNTLPDHVGKRYCLQCKPVDKLTRVSTLCVCPSCLSAPKKKAIQWEGRVMCKECFGEHMNDPDVRAQIQGHVCTICTYKHRF